MKELTRIITVQITLIGNVNDESAMVGKDECVKFVEQYLKDHTGSDDVKVIDVQDFIIDKDKPEQQENWKDSMMQHFGKGE